MKNKNIVPDVQLDTPIESIKKYAKNLIISIETNNEIAVNNNISWLRLAINEYDNLRFGGKELPF